MLTVYTFWKCSHTYFCKRSVFHDHIHTCDHNVKLHQFFHTIYVNHCVYNVIVFTIYMYIVFIALLIIMVDWEIYKFHRITVVRNLNTWNIFQLKFKHLESKIFCTSRCIYVSTSLNGSLMHKDLLQSLQPIILYLCKRDNLARKIPFHMLPCCISVYQSMKTLCIKISRLK